MERVWVPAATWHGPRHRANGAEKKKTRGAEASRVGEFDDPIDLPTAIFHAGLGAFLNARALPGLHTLRRAEASGENRGEEEKGGDLDDVIHVGCIWFGSG